VIIAELSASSYRSSSVLELLWVVSPSTPVSTPPPEWNANFPDCRDLAFQSERAGKGGERPRGSRG